MRDWKQVQEFTRDYPELAELIHEDGSDEFSSMFDLLTVAQDPVLEGVADYVRAVRQAVTVGYLDPEDRDTLLRILRKDLGCSASPKEEDSLNG